MTERSRKLKWYLHHNTQFFFAAPVNSSLERDRLTNRKIATKLIEEEVITLFGHAQEVECAVQRGAKKIWEHTGMDR